MKVDLATGLLEKANYSPSPNFDGRPPSCEVDLLVIHNISLPPGVFGTEYVHHFFTNQLDITRHEYFKEIAAVKVSSHLFINREGEIWQFVPFHKRAWHAGESLFGQRENCNNFSIGIELEGTDWLPYTPIQYKQLTKATQAIRKAYPKISFDRIVGHCDIAPARKTDPGPSFDWEYYRKLLGTVV